MPNTDGLTVNPLGDLPTRPQRTSPASLETLSTDGERESPIFHVANVKERNQVRVRCLHSLKKAHSRKKHIRSKQNTQIQKRKVIDKLQVMYCQEKRAITPSESANNSILRWLFSFETPCQ